MDIPIRIRPNPFLEQPERVMERIQWEETPRLGVSEGIRLRIGPSPFLERPERVMERIPRRDWKFRMIKLQEDKAAAKEGKAQRPDYPPRKGKVSV